MRRRLAVPVSFQDVGLHSGEAVALTVKPAPWGSGYRVCWGDEVWSLEQGSFAGDGRGTTLTFGNRTLMTVEHLLAVLRGLELDDVELHPRGIETPLLDGSGRDFLKALREAGVEEGPGEPDWLAPSLPLVIQSPDGAKTVMALPGEGLKITYVIDYPGTAIGTQMVTVDVRAETFERELALCRTFCLEEELNALRERGLVKGGSLESAVVVGPQGPINPGGYRCENELARHKALDFFGDLSLLGRRLRGHFIALRAGHAMHLKLVDALRRGSDF